MSNHLGDEEQESIYRGQLKEGECATWRDSTESNKARVSLLPRTKGLWMIVLCTMKALVTFEAQENFQADCGLARKT